jgi:hypothetical protein
MMIMERGLVGGALQLRPPDRSRRKPSLLLASLSYVPVAWLCHPAMRRQTMPEALDRTVPLVPDHELLEIIGSGSYGEVWLARSRIGALRAVKLVHRFSFENDRPFQREFKGIQKFEPVSRTHEGLVDILQVGGTEDSFYYVMELGDAQEDGCQATTAPGNDGSVSGPRGELRTRSSGPSSALAYVPRTLRHELKRFGRLPAERCVEIGLALASALAHLHRHGLVHRDIKPSNIIFVKGTPKLADIGLVTDADRTVSYVGTEGYIPPEGPGSVSADIYGLGKVLYEISTGKDRHEFPEPLTQLASMPEQKLLLELNVIIHKACHSQPAERYRRAEEMRDDLALLQQGASIRKRRHHDRYRRMARRWLLRMPYLRRALEQEPDSVIINSAIGSMAWFDRDYDQAIQAYRQTLKMDDKMPTIHAYLGNVCEFRHLDSEAVKEYRKAATLAGTSNEILDALDSAYQEGGLHGYWQKSLEFERAKSNPNALRIALIYAHLKDKEKTIEWLENAFGDPDLIDIKANSWLDFVRSDRRFQALLERMHLPGP